MNIREIIIKEASDIRTKATQLIDAAEAEKAKLEAQAIALEQKLVRLPAEIEELVDETATKVWSWIKGEV